MALLGKAIGPVHKFGSDWPHGKPRLLSAPHVPSVAVDDVRERLPLFPSSSNADLILTSRLGGF